MIVPEPTLTKVGGAIFAGFGAAFFKKSGGTAGYEVADLRELVITVSGKRNGQAVKTFDSAFLGGQALDLDGLFSKLGITCDSEGDCRLVEISKDAANTRSKVFKAGK
jgi:hypothetical protein